MTTNGMATDEERKASGEMVSRFLSEIPAGLDHMLSKKRTVEPAILAFDRSQRLTVIPIDPKLSEEENVANVRRIFTERGVFIFAYVDTIVIMNDGADAKKEAGESAAIAVASDGVTQGASAYAIVDGGTRTGRRIPFPPQSPLSDRWMAALGTSAPKATPA